ncbi:MAG: Ig domain-containing protein [Clostridia bacterium]|jgi:uncharacterized protein YjdB
MKSKKTIRNLLSVVISVALISTTSFFAGTGIVKALPTVIHVATDTSPAVYKNALGVVLCPGGALPSSLKAALLGGNVTVYFAPGEYWVEGPARQFTIGSNSIVQGETPVVLPADKSQMLYPDPANQAVFVTKTFFTSTTEASSSNIAYINIKDGATNVKVQDVELSGYIVLKLSNVKDSTIKNVLIHNYNGIYPNGTWCNMGYNATGTVWLSGANNNITMENMNVQCSSHHSFAMQTGSNAVWAKNIFFKNCRALYAGCGQLRGDSDTNIQESINATKDIGTNGYGYMDWSVGFDFCENQSVENLQATDCYALDAWKAGFYTEPEATGGHIINISLKRCVSVNGGQRALVRDENGNPVTPRVTKVRETEGCNFYFQGGYFEDCISINGEKCGWLLGLERGLNKNKDYQPNTMGKGVCEMVRCGDRGSPVSVASEMRLDHDWYCDSFMSILPTRYAFEIFGDDRGETDEGGYGDPRSANLNLTNSIIIPGSQTNEPIAVCKMERMQLIESLSVTNQQQVKPGGKYDMFAIPINIETAVLQGTVYNYPKGNLVYIHLGKGNKWNGSQDPILAAKNLVRSPVVANPDSYIPLNITSVSPVVSVKLNKTSAALKVAQTLQLTATITPADALPKLVTWKSSNTKVVTVSTTGKITAKGPGVATITVKTASLNKTATCKVTVTQPVKSVKLSKTILTLKKAKTYTLKATISPTNASNKKVTWKTSNKKIAIVSTTGKITAKGKGTVYITVTTVDGKKTARCKVIVK